MSWWKSAQLQQEAGVVDWLRRRPHIGIPALVLAGLSVMGSLEQVRQRLFSLPPQQQSTYVEQVQNEVEGVFERNPAVRQEAEDFLQQHPQLTETQPASQLETQPATRPARGIRNNNPGNIDWKSDVPWKGMDQPAHDGRFIRFETPEDGLRAMARVLRNYQRKYNLFTLNKIISRWAPPSENDTQRYVSTVSKIANIDPNQKIDLNNDELLADLMEAMIKVENGSNPYNRDMILRGIQMEKE